MKLLRLGIAGIFVGLAFIAVGRAQVGQIGPSTLFVAPGGGGSYTGPVDILASPTFGYGLRAASAADRGNPLVELCTPLDAACEVESSSASTGALVLGATGSTCNNSTVICTAKELYSRTGGNNITQATIADRYTFVVSCIGSLPCLNNANVPTGSYQATIPTTNQPLTISVVMENLSGTTTGYDIYNTSTNAYIYVPSSNTWQLYMGNNSQTFSAADGTMHTLQALVNGASTEAYLDGNAGVSLSPGSNGYGTSVALPDGAGGTNHTQFTEVYGWASVPSSTVAGQLHTNECTYWGTTC